MNLLNYKALLEIGVLTMYFSAIISTLHSAGIFMLYANKKFFGQATNTPSFEIFLGTPLILWMIYIFIS